MLIILFNGLIWARSSLGKFAGGTFVDGLGATLGKFASKNPYPWFKDFLEGVAIPGSQFFGQLVLWGEALVAISVTLGALYLLLNKKADKTVLFLFALGLLGGALMNLFFWLASGYTSPSTDGLNLVMLVTQLVGAAYIIRLQIQKA